MGLIQLLILALVQGITEFLPISSSAHLILAPEVTGSADQGPLIDVMAHLGTLFAVLVYFRRDVVNVLTGKLALLQGRVTEGGRLVLLIAVATPPVLVFGGILYVSGLADALRDPLVIAWATLIFALPLWLADHYCKQIKTAETLSYTGAFLIGLAWPAAQGRAPLAALRQPLLVWAVGVGGLFCFHFFFFMALKLAPPVEASLINYTWPLLIVVFSALLPGERLRWWHAAGAAMGLAGAALLITGGGGLALRPEHAAGYAAAVGSAVTWAGYSLISRRLGAVPTDAVGGFCGATAVLALLCHLAFERTVWPEGAGWLAVLALGLGPVGLAFFTWDHGVKRGDIRALGAFGYGAPLLSTLLLIAFGEGRASWSVAIACVLIVGGAALAARDLFRRRGPAANLSTVPRGRAGEGE